MQASEIADLITQGIQGPTGAEDLALHTGVILSWDESSGTNAVLVGNSSMTNLKAVQPGIGMQYVQGDVVLVVRKQTQYFVLGKVAAPGGNNTNQIKSAEVVAQEISGSTTYGDLATYGPELTINIGSSRRFLLMVNCYMFVSGTVAANTLVGGNMTVNVTGASIIPVVGTVSAAWVGNGITNGSGGGGQFSRMFVMTAANGVNPGPNTFTAKYKTALLSPAVSFQTRNITVIPF